MKLKLFIYLLLCMLSYTNSFSQDWILVGNSTENNPYYINSSLLEKDGENIKIWIKTTFKKKTVSKKTNKTSYITGEDKILYEFNCVDKMLKLIYAIKYNSLGKLISSFKPEEYEQEWEYVVPDSIGENLLNKACELYNN